MISDSRCAREGWQQPLAKFKECKNQAAVFARACWKHQQHCSKVKRIDECHNLST
jgi:hypothetical protein